MKVKKSNLFFIYFLFHREIKKKQKNEEEKYNKL